ncbi:MAG: amidase [Rhodoferax sp.]|nr:amidase [Rhodoferax sp.]MCP5262252.1 amidase [Rhodoferax sp.]
MNFDEYRSFDALGLAGLIRKREVSRAEVMQAALSRLQAVNPTINAVPYLHQPALAPDAPVIGADGPFAGVPYCIKDLHAPVRDMPLTHGSRLFAGQVFDFDAETVARLRRAGFVIIGRTNSPEFGMNVTTEPALHGPTRNPWNLAHGAGGSSGGAGAAVASGILPATHATDSGGSIRIPASCNGLFGLKPTRALLPYGPHRGDAAHGISHEHAVTRSVRDCAAILDATAGPDVGAPYFTQRPAERFLDGITRAPGPLRIAYTLQDFSGQPVHAECRAAVEAAAQLLAGLGHHVEAATPAFDYDALFQAVMTVMMTGLASNVDAREQQLGRPARADELERVTHAAVARGRGVSGTRYVAQFPRINREVRRIGQFFEQVDMLLTPTMAAPPPRLGTLSTDTDDLDAFIRASFGLAPFTTPFNATGQPAASLPLHWSADGLPVGVQLVGRFGADAQLLALAAQIEQAAPWFDRVPTL